MADDLLTLSELVTINDQNLSDVEGISDLLQDAPFLARVAADFASNGTKHSYLKETGAPAVGFRAVNAGRDHDHTEDTKVSIDLAILDASFHVDQAQADEYRFGRDRWMTRELNRHMRAAFAMAEKQIIYGTSNAAGGYDGMIDAATIDELSDDMVVNAGGSQANNLTSVYAVRTTSDLMNFALITGQEGRFAVDPYFLQLVEDSGGKKFPAYVQTAYGYLGVQVGSKFSMGRVCNLDDGTGSNTTLTDDMLSQLIETFPSQRPPTHLLMNRRSLGQLQRSRTATNPTGMPAPRPNNYEGIPIVVTDSINNSETEVE